jgi:para-nitrobenzyl esterase
MNTVENARLLTHRVLDELGLAPSEWRQLLHIPAERLLAVQLKVAAMPNSGSLFTDKHGVGVGMSFAPVVDGHVLLADPFDPRAPAISRDKPLIVGYNHDEYAFFAMYGGDAAAFTLDEQALRDRLKAEMPDDYEKAIAVYRAGRPEASPADIYIAIRSARFAATGSILIAERKAQENGAPVFAYIFDYQLETRVPRTDHPVGAMHALEIPFKFDNVYDTGIHGGPNLAGVRPERIRAGANMSAMWTSFARTGMPMAPGQPHWPPYTLERRATMIIDAVCKVVDDPGSEERRFWAARPDRLGSASNPV